MLPATNNSSESFQNVVLRPIIKAKNDFIMSYFKIYSRLQKLNFDDAKVRKDKIETLLKTDIYIKNIYIGAIISDFNNDQLIDYHSNKTELSRRIITIISKRIFDNYEQDKLISIH